MIREQTVFVTDDDQKHDTLQAAKRHEAKQALATMLGRLAWQGIDANDVLEFLIDNAPTIRERLYEATRED